MDTKKLLIILDGSPKFNIGVNEKTKISDIKKVLKNFFDQNKLDVENYLIQFNINSTTQVPVFNTRSYDDMTLEGLFDKINNGQIFIKKQRRKFTGMKDIDLKIMREMDDVELINFCQINKYVNELCKSQKQFWRERLSKKVEDIEEGFDTDNWYKLYTEYLRLEELLNLGIALYWLKHTFQVYLGGRQKGKEFINTFFSYHLAKDIFPRLKKIGFSNIYNKVYAFIEQMRDFILTIPVDEDLEVENLFEDDMALESENFEEYLVPYLKKNKNYIMGLVKEFETTKYPKFPYPLDIVKDFDMKDPEEYIYPSLILDLYENIDEEWGDRSVASFKARIENETFIVEFSDDDLSG